MAQAEHAIKSPARRRVKVRTEYRGVTLSGTPTLPSVLDVQQFIDDVAAIIRNITVQGMAK